MESKNFKHWISRLAPNTCPDCIDLHGKIYGILETPEPNTPLHPFCYCVIKPMKSIRAGDATDNKLDGADFWLKYTGGLPEYYVTRDFALLQGWKQGKHPSNFVPNKMITAGIYDNDNGHLPYAPGRTWQEADINYKTGKRNSSRIVWSNDGLIFVTYDHYKTFYEII